MIKAIGNRGGVIGLNFYPDFLETDSRGTIDSLIRHLRHFISVGGIECVGLGTDFDGIELHEEIRDASYMMKFCNALEKNGFTNTEILKILGENVLRVYKECL